MLHIIEVHLQPVPVTLVLNSSCLFLARDPIRRLASAISFRRQEIQIDGWLGRDVYARDGADAPTFYSCFSCAEQLGQMLRTDPNTTCGKLAHRALTRPPLYKHVSQGLEFYYSEVLDLLPLISYMLLEPETFLPDLQCLYRRWFPQIREPTLADLPWRHENAAPTDKMVLSPESEEILQQALSQEYVILARLRHFATRCDKRGDLH